MEIRYRIVSDYGYGDRTWIDRFLTEDQVVTYFIQSRGYSKDINLSDCPTDSDFTYFYEVDGENDTEDWNWEDS